MASYWRKGLIQRQVNRRSLEIRYAPLLVNVAFESNWSTTQVETRRRRRGRMKRVTLTLLLFSFAVGGSLAGIFSNSQIVYAQCTDTKNGKTVTASDGTMLCDCTVTT